MALGGGEEAERKLSRCISGCVVSQESDSSLLYRRTMLAIAIGVTERRTASGVRGAGYATYSYL